MTSCLNKSDIAGPMSSRMSGITDFAFYFCCCARDFPWPCGRLAYRAWERHVILSIFCVHADAGLFV